MDTSLALERNPVLSKTEKSILALGVLLILSALILHYSKKSEEEILSTPIGKVVLSDGLTSRERASSVEFKSISREESVFPYDTLMTGPNSSIVLELKGGRKFEMGSNTLIKLSFDYDFFLLGFVPRALVYRFSKPKAITITPVQSNIKTPKIKKLILSEFNPSPHTSLRYSAEEFLNNRKMVDFSFRGNQRPEGTNLHIVAPDGSEAGSIFPKIDDTGAMASFEFHPEMHPPGTYHWEVRNADNKVIESIPFDFNPIVQVIETLPTLGDDNRLKGLAAEKDFKGFTLRWKPIPGVGSYQVKVLDDQTNSVLLQKAVNGTALILNRKKVLTQKMYYTVERNLANQFIGTSDKNSFGLGFFPPELTTPESKSQFSLSELGLGNHFILFTWTKTNYTQSYTFELSSDIAFTNIVLRKEVKSNFYNFYAQQPGYYFWRVRSLNEAGVRSAYSRIRGLRIIP